MLALSRRSGQSIRFDPPGTVLTYKRPTRQGVLVSVKSPGKVSREIDIPNGLSTKIGDVEVSPQWANNHKARLGFSAPEHIRIMRSELLTKGTEK